MSPGRLLGLITLLLTLLCFFVPIGIGFTAAEYQLPSKLDICIMDFLVIANNSIQDSWKIELLIQSFRMHGLEDKLVVGLKHRGKIKRSQLFSRNITSHERKFSFLELRYDPMFYGTFLAIENDIINPDSFTIIPSTSILLNPKKLNLDQNESQIIVASELRKHNSDLREQFESNNQWLPFQNTAVFNRVPKSYFAHLAQRSKYFQFPADCFNLTCVAYSKFLKFGVENLESPLVQDADTLLVNYKEGLPPILNLKEIEQSVQFWGEENFLFELLVKNKPTINAALLLETELAYRKTAKD